MTVKAGGHVESEDIVIRELWWRVRGFEFVGGAPVNGPVLLARQLKQVALFVYRLMKNVRLQEGYRMIIIIEPEPVDDSYITMSQGTLL